MVVGSGIAANGTLVGGSESLIGFMSFDVVTTRSLHGVTVRFMLHFWFEQGNHIDILLMPGLDTILDRWLRVV